MHLSIIVIIIIIAAVGVSTFFFLSGSIDSAIRSSNTPVLDSEGIVLECYTFAIVLDKNKTLQKIGEVVDLDNPFIYGSIRGDGDIIFNKIEISKNLGELENKYEFYLGAVDRGDELWVQDTSAFSDNIFKTGSEDFLQLGQTKFNLEIQSSELYACGPACDASRLVTIVNIPVECDVKNPQLESAGEAEKWLKMKYPKLSDSEFSSSEISDGWRFETTKSSVEVHSPGQYTSVLEVSTNGEINEQSGVEYNLHGITRTCESRDIIKIEDEFTGVPVFIELEEKFGVDAKIQGTMRDFDDKMNEFENNIFHVKDRKLSMKTIIVTSQRSHIDVRSLDKDCNFDFGFSAFQYEENIRDIVSSEKDYKLSDGSNIHATVTNGNVELTVT